MSFQIKKGDKVRVRRGKDKGNVQRVLEVFRDERGRVVKVKVEHVNMASKHTRQTQKTQGGISHREMPIAISNVMLVDPKTNTATRFGSRLDDAGRRERVTKKSQSTV